MKQIGIVTVYNSLNCGSFLQSYAMQTILRKHDFNALFVKTKARSLLKFTVAQVINSVKKRDIALARVLFNEYLSFRKANKKLKRVGIKKASKSCDAFILGSDEIWNVNRLQMRMFPIFWGVGLPLQKCISYAPSINNCTSIDLEATPFFKDNLKEMLAVSVRDIYSLKEIEKLVPDKDIKICCDPTLLLEKADYYSVIKTESMRNYIFVYDFDRITESERQAIKSLSKKMNKQLVIMGDRDWGDVRISKDPFRFVSLIRDADYVITGTFHGTLFSILFQKQFVALARKNQKIYEILKEYGLMDYAFDSKGSKSLDEIICKPYDRNKVEELISCNRKKGIAFLIGTLKAGI